MTIPEVHSKRSPSQNDLLSVDLLELVDLAGKTGQLWLQQYRQNRGPEIEQVCHQALHLLRQRELPCATELFGTATSMLQKIDAQDLSVRYVAARWFCTSLAYYHYLVDGHTLAMQLLAASTKALARSIGRHHFLMPLAVHVVPIKYQMTRVAIRQGRQMVARQQLVEAVAMCENREPLCRPSGGSGIYLETIRDFLATLELSARQQQELGFLLEPGFMEKFVQPFKSQLAA